MKKIVKLFTTLLCVTFLINNNVVHVHSDDITCPYCGSSNVVLILSSATCTESGNASYECLNTEAPEHSAIAAAPQPTTFRTSQPALGHDLVTSITREATCTEEGKIVHQCSRCSYSETETIPLLDHEYKKTVVKKVSCLEGGLIEYECVSCKDKYSEVMKALGHNYKETENKEATCTEDGYILKTCKNCNDEEKTILKAFGHDVVLEIKKEATCTEEGLKSGICKNCNEELTEKIPALGHDYPDEWIVDKKASIFSEGLKSKFCKTCNEKIEETIPKKNIPTSVYVGGVSAVAAIGFAFFALKKSASIKATKKKIENVEKEPLEPSFEERTIVTSMDENDFYNILKAQKYIKVIESEFESLNENIEENEPSLTLIDLSNKNINDSIEYLNTLKEELNSPLISIFVSGEQMQLEKSVLDQLKQDEIIKDYIDVDTNPYVILVKFILPIMKPDLKSDEALQNIGMVADALNIPGISLIIDTFISAREIKTTYDEGKEEGLSFSDKSLIISDIASILQLDTISSVTGLVSDLDDIKSSLESKIGANEISTTKSAVSDIVDVINNVKNG